MYECPVNHTALPALFDPTIPDQPVLWAVLKGRHAGKALVDDLQNPSQCVLRTDAVLTFPSQQITQAFLNEAVALFRQTAPVWLVWPPAISAELLEPGAAQIVQRIEFYDYDARSTTLAGLRQSLPDGFEIRPIDRQLLERCEWRSDMEFYCGSLDNFLTNGMGLCLMQGEEIIVEAYVSSFGDRTAEIGAITRQAYRGHGYAPIAYAHLIEAGEQRGYQAYWSCDADNPASIRVAGKLGFQQEKAYQILGYSP
jgi:GNAT superfamily N-acetyltransferase